MFAQYDYGAGTRLRLSLPVGTKLLRAFLCGGGGGGGGGSATAGGGGGGSGCNSDFIVQLDPALTYTIEIECGLGGNGGAPHPTHAGAGAYGTPTTLTWANGWQWMAGGGEGGVGATAVPPSNYASGEGGHSGNAAATEHIPRPPGVRSFGQRNFAGVCGQPGRDRCGGFGGRLGDTGGGGRGGNGSGQPGLAGDYGGQLGTTNGAQGGYAHLEVE